MIVKNSLSSFLYLNRNIIINIIEHSINTERIEIRVGSDEVG